MPSLIILVLAGGKASRMGGRDKALLPLGNATILDHVLARLAGQGSPMVLSANGDPARFASFGLTVLPDTIAGWPGPLAGILAGMLWAAEQFGDAADLVTVPADCPFLPRDLVARLVGAREAAGAELALAASRGRLHPVAGLWPARLAGALRKALEEEGLRRVEGFASRYRRAVAAFGEDELDPFFPDPFFPDPFFPDPFFPDPFFPDPFFNVNHPEDRDAAEALVKQAGCIPGQPPASGGLVGRQGRSEQE